MRIVIFLLCMLCLYSEKMAFSKDHKSDVLIFDKYCEYISNKYGFCVIAESYPIPNNDIWKIKDRNFSESDYLMVFKNIFGYDVTKKGNILILKKDYLNSKDFPDVSIDELIFSLKNYIVEINNMHYLYKKTDNIDLKFFVSSLTGNDFNKMHSSSGIRFSEMNPLSVSLLKDIIINNSFNFVNKLEVELNRLQILKSEKCEIKKIVMIENTPPIIVLQGRFLRGNIKQYAISHGFMFSEETNMAVGTSGAIFSIHSFTNTMPYQDEIKNKLQKFLNELKDTTSPNNINLLDFGIPYPPYQTTIGQLFDNDPILKIDESLKKKKISIFGKDIVSMKDIHTCIVDIFGFSIKKSENEVLTITYRKLNKILQLKEISAMKINWLPDNFKRAYIGLSESLSEKIKQQKDIKVALTEKYIKYRSDELTPFVMFENSLIRGRNVLKNYDLDKEAIKLDKIDDDFNNFIAICFVINITKSNIYAGVNFDQLDGLMTGDNYLVKYKELVGENTIEIVDINNGKVVIALK